MTLSVVVDGHLVERHENLELNGVRYLLEPVPSVSYCWHLPPANETAETFRIIKS